MASESFDPALAAVLKHEGGYSDHHSDPGGATMMGITQASLAKWRGGPVSKADVRALTREEAGDIYRVRYWRAVSGDLLPAGLDLALFDFAVNSGPSRAIRTLQVVLGVSIDGRVGPETLSAVHGGSAAKLIEGLSAHRMAFVQGLSTFPVFGRGWTRRIRDVERASLRLAAAAMQPALPPSNPLSSTSQTQENAMDITKTVVSSRTLWANAVGFAALALSWLGFDTSSVDKTVLTENLLQAVAGLSFVVSTIFRVIATKRLV